MTAHRIITLTIAAIIGLTACGGDDDTVTIKVDASLVEAINEQRQRDNCEAEFKTIDIARQAFFAVYPNAPSVTEQQLIEEKLLRQEMPNHDIEADGTVFATDDGACS